MKLTARKIFGKIHLWLGLASGLVIFIVAITGAIYVFSGDIISITESSFTRVQAEHTKPLAASQLTAIALKERKRYLGDKKVPEWDWASLYVFNDAGAAVRFTSRHYKNPDQLVDIFINPYNGRVLHTRNTYAAPFWDAVIDLHTSLMLGDAGTYIVEYATLIFFVMLITGIVLWWPRNKPGIKQRLWFRWKKVSTWKRKNYDLHNIPGFYAMWIVLFMTITGLGWSFQWVKDVIYVVLNSKEPAAQHFDLHTRANHPDSAAPVIDQIYAAVKSMDAGANSYNLNFATKENEPFNVYAQQTTNWSPGNDYYFNPQTGALLSKKGYSGLSAGQKYEQMAGDIHYGWVFGWPSKIATFLACLVVASLPITGFMVWLGRRKKKA